MTPKLLVAGLEEEAPVIGAKPLRPEVGCNINAMVGLVAPVPLAAEEKEVAVIEAKPSRPEVE